MEQFIRLFRAVEIKYEGKGESGKNLLRKTIKNGFIFSPEVIYNYSDEKLEKLADLVEKEIGISSGKMNNTFHKSWKKVKEANIEQLVIEQLIHYVTTYGFELLGIYDENSVYIPNEKLELPKINTDKFVLTIIKGYTTEEIKAKTIDLLKTGIALKESTIKDIVEVAKYVGIGHNQIDDIKNKEVKIALCDYAGLFPKNPVEFLRYVIYKINGNTLLIKDRSTISTLKTDTDEKTSALFTRYADRYGFQELAKIFHRFKPIFLAMKSEDSMKPIINKLRKLAIKNHVPMAADYLNDITAMVKNGKTINRVELLSYLNKANPFRKIRLAYALKYRMTDTDSILYKIRNGKSFAKEFNFNKKAEIGQIFDIVITSIIEDMRDNVAGKKIFIPDYIRYALPATEKQFTGNFPSGTCVTVPRDMVFGIHWYDTDNYRVDLDLSLMNPKVGKIGWDSSYRTKDRTILFSGDLTSAPKPNGASELFYVQRQMDQEFIMFVNFFNFRVGREVPVDIIVAKEKVVDFGKHYMIDPNNVVTIAKTKINIKQKMLGIVALTLNRCEFYFSESELGKSITASFNSKSELARKYLIKFNINSINFNDILVGAGAILVDDEDKCDINLSPNNIEKDTIIKLLT